MTEFSRSGSKTAPQMVVVVVVAVDAVWWLLLAGLAGAALSVSSLGLLYRPCNSVHGACGVAFRVAHPKSSRFSSRASRQNTGVLHVPVPPQSMLIEGVGFELSV